MNAVFVLLGAVLLVGGCGLYDPPLAPISGGLLLLAAGLASHFYQTRTP